MPAPLFPHAAVASPYYLASSAGLAVLASGGNAVDAAVACNLVLAVAYPHMCGLGGDLFAMVWADGELSGLNSSGRLPAAARLDGEAVPRTGIGSAVVPGGVAGWLALLQRYGTRRIGDLAPPAIRLAREGCPRAPGLERITKAAAPLIQRDEETARIFLAEGPLRQPELAETLEAIDEFYTGPVARNAPPPFRPEDFAEHHAEWVAPERTAFAGLEVCEMPPNSRGHLALRAIEQTEPLDGLTPDDPEFHLRMIRALDAVAEGGSTAGDTIYLCVRDENGMAVSLNQSLYQAFGSGVVVPGTGVLLNNRASYFKPHEYGPGKRPVHTLAPAMALRDGKPRLVFGTMGGDTQIEIHLQLLARVFIAGQEVGEVIAAPRWMHRGGRLVAETGLPQIGADPLPAEFPELAGHAHAILVEDGHLAAAFDPRSDGAAVGY
ncbi:MAG TPA: gamma-glutamyltransferase [Dehalococcoidia bacterium]|jgi:gamma-glutamyltranspeptidase/glutathione hydrolase|nr:gamma-glutamyltransferase [Dehalococcoidia bacterium]